MTLTRRLSAALLPPLAAVAVLAALAGLGLCAAGRQVGVPLTVAGMAVALTAAPLWRLRFYVGRHRVSAGHGGVS